MTRRTSFGPRLWVLLGAAQLLLGAAVIVGPTAANPTPAAAAVPQATANTQPTTGTTGGLVPCPAGVPSTDTCAAMPCKAGQYCGTVVADPTQDLGPGQFVYLSFSGFAPDDNGVIVYYCSDPGGGSTLNAPGGAPPTCADQNTNSFSEARQFITTYPATSSAVLPPGTAGTAMQAAEVASPSNPLQAAKYEPAATTEPGFYCDGSVANACSIVITDAAITPGNSVTSIANSVEIPITFQPTTGGCPNGAVVPTESEFGTDLLMPTLARLSCQSNPATAVIPDETATDGLSAVTDLGAGSFAPDIAFTDDPEAADQQAKLKSGSFALIPVALTANVVGFYSQLFVPFPATFFPLQQMDLTPTMAAGLLTHYPGYPDAHSTDDSDPCSGPSLGTGGNCLSGPGPCFGQPTCSLYSQLNFVNGFNQFVTYTSVLRSDTAGATDQLFTWLCDAPKIPLDFGTHPTESTSGTQILEDGLSSGAPLSTCPAGVDQVPPYKGTAPFITVNDPNQQSLKAYQGVFNSGVSTGATSGFTDMNWGESRYYGMSVAALQNAAGSFVQPTAASLDAAVNDAQKNPDGSLTPVNSASDPAAYPMPSVIYAVVNTAPRNASQATADITLLTQLLDLTGGNNTSHLPQGFVPLPAPLLTAARADVTKDITPLATPASSGSSSSSGAAGPGSSSAQGGQGGTGGLGGSQSGLGAGLIDYSNLPLIGGLSPLGAAMLASVNALAAAAAAGHNHLRSLLGPNLPGYALVTGRGSQILSLTSGFGLAALLLGVLLMGWGVVVWRRRLATAAAGLAEAGAAGAEASEVEGATGSVEGVPPAPEEAGPP
jgi:hypothetical protein